MLIVEDEEANYEPIAVAVSITEAKQIAQDDMKRRLRGLEHDGDPGICPYEYKLWARGADGRQHVAAAWLASEL